MAYHSHTRSGLRAKPSGVASSIGSYSAHRPCWASRKVGTPLSAEMPAPVRATTRCACRSSATSSSSSTRFSAIIPTSLSTWRAMAYNDDPLPPTSRASARMSEIILINISGQDKPGLTASLMGILAEYNVGVLDIGQAMIHDTLSLGMLLEIPDQEQR